jgi:hypothetical protein
MLAPMDRRTFGVLLALSAISCGAPQSTLHQLGTPKGSGPIDFQVENRTGTVINNLWIAKTAAVSAAPRAAFESGSPEQQKLWGDDQLVSSALEPGGKLRVPIAEPDRYDVRIADRDGREQHIAGLKVAAGGRYVLELNDSGWRHPL